MLKALERVAKTTLALWASLFLWRPGRRALAKGRLAQASRVLLVRIDARVGEALLTTPLVQAIARARPSAVVDLLVHARCAPLLEGCPGLNRVTTFDRRRLWLGSFAPGIRRVRESSYDVVVDASNWTAPSVTSALVSRLVAPSAAVVGPGRGAVRGLRDVAIDPLPNVVGEIPQRLHLLSPLLGEVPHAGLTFRSLGGSAHASLADSGPFAIVNPGGRLRWRRLPPSLFAAAARALLSRGMRVLVAWGPAEEALADEVVIQAPGAERAPPTSLEELAWLFSRARLAVCNNSGPMHLAVAVGTPTLGLFLKMEVERWGHFDPPHRMLDLTTLLPSGEGVEQRLLETLDQMLGRTSG